MRELIDFGEMQLEDAPEVAALSGQLGYPCSAEELRPRIAILLRDPYQQLRVARAGARVVGWVHFHLHRSLATEPRLEIANIVVDEDLRGNGIGSKLLALAEEWGRAQGLQRVRLASRVTRTDTHRLYLKLGYTINKTSHFFDKPL